MVCSQVNSLQNNKNFGQGQIDGILKLLNTVPNDTFYTLPN